MLSTLNWHDSGPLEINFIGHEYLCSLLAAILAIEVGQGVARGLEALMIIDGVDNDEGVGVIGGQGVFNLKNHELIHNITF